MADISSFLNDLRSDGSLYRIALDPRAQFGVQTRQYRGAEVLPERLVEVNSYREEQIRYRTVIANGGTRYSPVQRKGSDLVGSFDVRLAESDIGDDFTSQLYDVLIRMLQGTGTLSVGSLASGAAAPAMQAVLSFTNFLETKIRDGLVELAEVWRWQAMVNGVVNVRGDNGFAEDISYPRYADLHFTAGGHWSDNSYDPYTDIFNAALALSNRGLSPARLFIGRQALNIFGGNLNVRARVGKAVIQGGVLKGTVGRANLAEINSQNEADGLPPFELYDLQYRTQTGAHHFLQRDAFVMVAGTGRNEELDLGDGQFETIENVVGYTALGRPAGAAAPGRHIVAIPEEDKPPRIVCQGWQTMLPVITEPEAIAAVTGVQ